MVGSRVGVRGALGPHLVEQQSVELSPESNHARRLAAAMPRVAFLGSLPQPHPLQPGFRDGQRRNGHARRTQTAPALAGDHRASEPQESAGRSMSASNTVERLPPEQSSMGVTLQRVGVRGTYSSQSELSSDSLRTGAQRLFQPLAQSTLAISLKWQIVTNSTDGL